MPPIRPAHLVLTNDAGRPEETLLAVAGRLAERAGPADDVCDRLFYAARSLAGRTGLPATPELLVGPTDPTLTEYVRMHEFDLVS